MDHLPLEVNLKVFSHLTLDELAHCRLVSHSFKLWAEASMQLITHLELRESKNRAKWDLEYDSDLDLHYDLDWTKTVEKEMKESYVQNTFFTKPFVMALVQIDEPRFYAFLGKFCPNLQVLRMEDFDISCEKLGLLGSKLQLFTCNQFSPGRSGSIDPSSLYQLPNLQGFIYSYVKDPDYTNSLNRELLQLNRTVCMVEDLGGETVKLLARGGVKCLFLLTRRSGRFSLPQSLAGSLVEMSVVFVPTGTFCPFSLPNLLYLTIADRWEEWPATNLTALVTAPNLRCLTCESKIAVDNLSNLMHFINSFNELRVLCITIRKSGPNPGQEKLKISLSPTLEKVTFKTRIPLELVDHSSTSLKYLVVQNVLFVSFVCPSLKVLICWEMEMDSESMSRLRHSLSHCVKLTKVALFFRTTHESVSLQPLVDLLSSITGLTHIKLFANWVSPPERTDLDPQNFPSLNSLHLYLPNAKIVFHLIDSFTTFELNWSVSSCIKLNSPHKNYSVDVLHAEILCNKELNNLVDVTVQYSTKSLRLIQLEDTSPSQNLQCFSFHSDTQTVAFAPWLFGLINSPVNLGETKLEVKNEEETALNVILPPKLKKMQLELSYSLNSLCLFSSILQYLCISHVHQLRLHMPNLREIQFRDWLEPLDDTLVMQLNALTSMYFYFCFKKEPSVAVIESHLQTASKLKHLTTLHFWCPHNWPECLGCVRIRQEDLPSVKDFSWDIPVSFDFYPQDKFTELKIHDRVSLDFLNQEQEYKYKFHLSKLVYTWSIELPQTGMAQLSHIDFSRVPLWYHDLDKFYLKLVERLTQVEQIQIKLKEAIDDNSDDDSDDDSDDNSDYDEFIKKCRAQADVVVEWLSSLTRLTKLQGYMSQSRLDQFLRKTRTAGPLELVILEKLVPREDAVHLDEGLHCTINDLMRRRVISKFSHPAKCGCKADCFINSQSGLDDSADT